MVGDVNLFLSVGEDNDGNNDDEYGTSSNNENAAVAATGATEKTETGIVLTKPHHLQAELNVMIAEKEYRGKGLGEKPPLS